MFALAMRDRMVMPGIFQAPKQVGKTPSAMRETDEKCARQPVKRPTQNQRHYGKLRLRWHADCPRHHVFRHALFPKHIPGVHEHSRIHIRAVPQKSHDPGIVEILVPHVVADLYTHMS